MKTKADGPKRLAPHAFIAAGCAFLAVGFMGGPSEGTGPAFLALGAAFFAIAAALARMLKDQEKAR